MHSVRTHRVNDSGEDFDGVGLLHSLHAWPIAVGVTHRRGEAIELVGLVGGTVHSEGSPAEFIIVKVSYCAFSSLRIPEFAETETFRLAIIWVFHESAAFVLQKNKCYHETPRRVVNALLTGNSQLDQPFEKYPPAALPLQYMVCSQRTRCLHSSTNHDRLQIGTSQFTLHLE